MKYVFLKGRSEGGLPHSLYRELLRFPPDGYRIFTRNAENTGMKQLTPFSKKQQLFYDLNRKLRGVTYDRLWREARTLFYMGLKETQRPRLPAGRKIDLVFSSQQLLFAEMPWVADFEYADALVDYGDIRLARRFIQKALRSRYCKKIMPWSEWSKRTLLRSMDCGSFREKIEVVHLGVAAKNFIKKTDKEKLRFLFVGSTNRLNYLNFEWKGGFEAAEAFVELSKKYDGLELVLRSWVPPEIKEKYGDKAGIIIIDNPLSEEDLASLYVSSDILLFPSHLNLGMAILEAMSYELPVIAIDVYDVSEALKDMKTGVLIKPPPNVNYYTWNGAANHQDNTLLPRIRQFRPWIVKRIVEKTSLLIEDASLRRRIGREAREETDRGEFSLTKRNAKLKTIFDEATAV
ncbi:glycosyltransferase family 4 protein [Candidatus Bathyarchaeota archaeon A05DMB-2]|jgi:glycosyltransferase involved in cell wall biosynthesis|nr:glycosyltransferase family 4 protein [Candidatus Bathyarchaeota archaeon A05DMB-2]